MVSHTSGQSLRILHLEDSVADHALTAITLRRAQVEHTMWHVDTLDGFRDLIAGQVFDIILADYKLPGFTALDAWACVAQKPQHPPFVLLSGAIGEAAAVDAMRLGIADYLLKDDLARLPHVIARALEVHEARRAREQAAAELAASERRLADLTEHLQISIEQERAAMRAALRPVAELMEEIGWTTPLASLSETQVLTLIEGAVGAFQEAMSASAAKSAISFRGLDGVSRNSILVLGRTAACHSAKSVCDTKVTSIPKRVTWFITKPMVVPNRLRLQIRWSPALRNVSIAA